MQYISKIFQKTITSYLPSHAPPSYMQTHVSMLKNLDKEIAITSETSFVVELKNGKGKKMILLDKKNDSQFVQCVLTVNDVLPVSTK